MSRRVLIEEITVGSGGAANIDFDSIPAIYEDLEIELLIRGETAADNVVPRLQFNGDTGSNYSYSSVYASSGGTSPLAVEGTTFIRLGICPAGNMNAASFASTRIVIPFYTVTSKYRNLMFLNGTGPSDSAAREYWSSGHGNWADTDAVDRVVISVDTGDVAEGSSARLYGVLATVDLKISELTAVTTLDGTEEFVLNDSGTSKKITAANLLSGVSSDPIAEIFGTPTTAFEFNASSFTGLTALSPTPDVEDMDTTVPGHYYLRDNNSAFSMVGRYATPPSAPFTAITKVTGNPYANFHGIGMFIGVTTPGAGTFLTWGNGSNIRELSIGRFNSPTSAGAGVANFSGGFPGPMFLAITVNSNTDVDYYGSFDGRVWFHVVNGDNPGITIASVGLTIFCNQGSAIPLAGAYDFLRIWDSALTFPGVP